MQWNFSDVDGVPPDRDDHGAPPDRDDHGAPRRRREMVGYAALYLLRGVFYGSI